VPRARPPTRCDWPEREIGLAGRQDFFEGPLQQSTAPTEPVVPVAEGGDPVLPGEHRLCLPRLRKAEIVEAEFTWNVRLMVSGVQRSGARHVRPLGESGTPPEVVLRNRVELREIERDDAHRAAVGGLLRAFVARSDHS
jgi:hypothetical protein